MLFQFLLQLVDTLLLQHILVVQRDLLEGHAFTGVVELAVQARGVGEGGVGRGLDTGRGTIDTGWLGRLGRLHKGLGTLHLVDHWGLVCPVLRLLHTLLHQLH